MLSQVTLSLGEVLAALRAALALEAPGGLEAIGEGQVGSGPRHRRSNGLVCSLMPQRLQHAFGALCAHTVEENLPVGEYGQLQDIEMGQVPPPPPPPHPLHPDSAQRVADRVAELTALGATRRGAHRCAASFSSAYCYATPPAREASLLHSLVGHCIALPCGWSTLWARQNWLQTLLWSGTLSLLLSLLT